MQINIQYPSYMPRSHTKEIIDLFFKEGLTYEEISRRLGKYKSIAEKAVQIYMPILMYDKEDLLERMKKYKESLEYTEDYKKATGLNYNYVRGRLLNNQGLALRTQLDLCKRYHVFVDVEWKYNPIGSWHEIEGVETPSEIAKNRIGFTPTRRHNKRSSKVDDIDFTDLVEKGDRSEVLVNKDVIENMRSQIIQILKDKGMSASTINRILEKTDSLARESTLLGIQSERCGVGHKLEKSILTHLQTI